MMAVDLPDNPFRQLIPVTKSNPLLRYIIVASSAAHMANSLKPPTAYGSINATTATDHVNMEASRRARIDALAAKQKALRLLYTALQNIETVGSDIVLTAVVFFINLECIESGKHGWKAHIEGCGRLLEHLPSTAVTSEPFIECIVSDFYMSVPAPVLSSQFINHHPGTTPLPQSSQGMHLSYQLIPVLTKPPLPYTVQQTTALYVAPPRSCRFC